jgi:glutathione synthase
MAGSYYERVSVENRVVRMNVAAQKTGAIFANSVHYRLVEVDDFLAQMWKIHLAVKEEGYTHEHTLGMFRSDYMLDAPKDSAEPSLKQVEFNTISSSFGGLASLVTKLHTEIATFPTSEHPFAYPSHPLLSSTSTSGPKSRGVPPPNEAVPTLTAGLAEAHKAYGPSKHSPPLPLCIIFLVQDNERNIFDQLALSTHLFTTHKIPSFRLPTSAILSQTSIPPISTNPSRPLIYTPPSSPSTPYEVSVVYFRALYSPTEYTSPTIWAGRHHLERSCATKCPSILLHLSGSKKIQQVLTSLPPDTDHLSAFLPHHHKPTLDSLRSTFAPQYSLTTPEGLDLALNPATAENHVLKPQREGGGNNIYRSNIPPFLKSLKESEYKAYILMQLIHPPADAKNTVLRSDGEVVSGNVISELGIFGTCLWKVPNLKTAADEGGQIDRDSVEMELPEIMFNNEGGYLLRTKASGSDEGGVAAGFSSLDSVILYE